MTDLYLSLSPEQDVSMRLPGSRSGKWVVMATELELVDLTVPFVQSGEIVSLAYRDGGQL